MEKFILNPQVNIEPLIMRWYAWAQLMAPQTLAANIVNRHLKIMDSFVAAPEVHAQAVASTKLKGSPFLDVPPTEVHQIKNLLDLTKKNSASLLKFAQDYWDFDAVLQEKTEGTSLEPFYAQLPDSLKGLVELVYDLQHRPHIRLIEPLIYKKYYQEDFQEICLSLGREEERPFSLSTPKINNSHQLFIKIPFASKNIDLLAKARWQPVNLDELIAAFNLKESEITLFKSFFIPESNKNYPLSAYYDAPNIRIRYFGHACVCIETNKTTVLIDPALSYQPSEKSDRFGFEHLPPLIDYVLITHNHQDHVMFETLLQIRHRIKNIVIPRSNIGTIQDPSLKLILQHLGFENIIVMDEFDTIPFNGDDNIMAIPFLGEHADLNIQTKMSYMVHILGHKFLFLADSNNLDPTLYRNIFNYVGKIDTVFIGMECLGAPLSWLYGALYANPIKRALDQSRRLSGSDCAKALEIIKESSCQQVFVYAMGQEPWLNYIMAINYSSDSIPITESNKFISACRQENIQAERLYMKKEWYIN